MILRIRTAVRHFLTMTVGAFPTRGFDSAGLQDRCGGGNSDRREPIRGGLWEQEAVARCTGREHEAPHSIRMAGLGHGLMNEPRAWNRWKSLRVGDFESLPCGTCRERAKGRKDSSRRE